MAADTSSSSSSEASSAASGSADYLFVGSRGKVACFLRDAPNSEKPVWFNEMKGKGSHLTSVLLAHDHLYVGVDGHLLALEPATGDVVWEGAPADYEFPKAPVTLTRCGDNILALCHEVLILVTRENKVLWKTSVKKHGDVGTLFVVGDTIYAGLSGSIYALDASNGEQRWKNTFSMQTLQAFGGMFIHGDRLFAGARSHFEVLDKNTGNSLIDQNRYRKSSVSVMPIHVDGAPCFLLSCYGTVELRGLDDANTYPVMWENDLKGCGYAPAITIGIFTEDLTCIAPPAYEEVEHEKGGKKDDEEAPLNERFVTDHISRAVLAGINGRIVAIRPEDGTTLWTTRLCGGAMMHPFTGFLVHQNRIYAGVKGKLFILDPQTGAVLFQDTLKGMGATFITMAINELHTDFNQQPVMPFVMFDITAT